MSQLSSKAARREGSWIEMPRTKQQKPRHICEDYRNEKPPEVVGSSFDDFNRRETLRDQQTSSTTSEPSSASSLSDVIINNEPPTTDVISTSRALMTAQPSPQLLSGLAHYYWNHFVAWTFWMNQPLTWLPSNVATPITSHPPAHLATSTSPWRPLVKPIVANSKNQAVDDVIKPLEKITLSKPPNDRHFMPSSSTYLPLNVMSSSSTDPNAMTSSTSYYPLNMTSSSSNLSLGMTSSACMKLYHMTSSTSSKPRDMTSSTSSKSCDMTSSTSYYPLNMTSSSSNLSLGMTSSACIKSYDMTSSTSSKPRDMTSSTSTKPRDMTSSTSSKPRDMTSSTSSKPRDMTSPTSSKPRDMTSSTSSKPRDMTSSTSSKSCDMTSPISSKPCDMTLSTSSKSCDMTSSTSSKSRSMTSSTKSDCAKAAALAVRVRMAAETRGRNPESIYLQCPVCKKRIKRLYHFHRHLRIHFGEKSHACPYCQYRSVRKDNLKSHMKTHDKNRKLNNRKSTTVAKEQRMVQRSNTTAMPRHNVESSQQSTSATTSTSYGWFGGNQSFNFPQTFMLPPNPPPFTISSHSNGFWSSQQPTPYLDPTMGYSPTMFSHYYPPAPSNHLMRPLNHPTIVEISSEASNFRSFGAPPPKRLCNPPASSHGSYDFINRGWNRETKDAGIFRPYSLDS